MPAAGVCSRRIVPSVILVAVCLHLAAAAQEGHPLVGTWAGDWTQPGGSRTHLTLVMTWDGKTVSGLINPGPEAIPLTRVTPDWEKWTVRIEAGTGTARAVVADARLEDIGSYHRRLVGTWTQGGVKGTVALTRE